MTSSVRKPSRLGALFAGLLGLASSPAAAQSLGPAEAPAAWVAYAETVSQAVSTWLEEDAEPSVAVRAYMGAAQAAEGEVQPLALKIWIDGHGRLTRIDFPPFAHAEANTALRDALVGRTLAASPPPDMIQPLRIAVQPGE